MQFRTIKYLKEKKSDFAQRIIKKLYFHHNAYFMKEKNKNENSLEKG